MTPAFVGFIVVALVGGAAEMASAFSGARKNRLDLSVGIALGSASQIALFVAPVLVLLSYVHRPDADGPAILAGRGGDDAHRHAHRVARDQQRAIGVVRRRAGADGLSHLRHDALSVAAASAVTACTCPRNSIPSSKRVLDPIERISEVLFGLIMVLTFTGSLSVAEAGTRGRSHDADRCAGLQYRVGDHRRPALPDGEPRGPWTWACDTSSGAQITIRRRRSV